jgi:ubiquinone/menaquinone biosynthesis C-methylase UbiE
MEEQYIVEPYWDEVAKNISKRTDIKIIAGEDDPFYRHKRKLFLKLFNDVVFSGKIVLEIGSGPGGNLALVYEKGCKKVTGVDISNEMIALAKQNLGKKDVEVIKIDGRTLPFEDGAFDLIYTSTVLQHNVQEDALIALVDEICRVSNSEIILFERIETKIKGNETTTGRPVAYYKNLVEKHNFRLCKTKFLPIQCSYYICGAIRKVFNSKNHKEGEPFTRLSINLQKLALPITKLLDKAIPSNRDVAMLHFKKI